MKNRDSNVIGIHRLPNLVFGLTQSLLIFKGTLKENFQYNINEYRKLIEAILEDI